MEIQICILRRSLDYPKARLPPRTPWESGAVEYGPRKTGFIFALAPLLAATRHAGL